MLYPTVSRMAGKPIMTSTVVLDLAGLSLRHLTSTTRHLLGEVARIDQVCVWGGGTRGGREK